MKKMIRVSKTLKFFGLMTLAWGLSSPALACPVDLLHFHTKYLNGYDLCLAHDRYQVALRFLKIRNVATPSRVENLRAPRFINLPDWQNRSSSTAIPYALHVYNPAPLTWQMWDAGAQIVDEDAKKNFTTELIPPLTLEWLKTVHGTSLNGLIQTAGKFRTAGEFGLMVNHKTSLTSAQLANATDVEYRMVSDPNKKLVSFTPFECLEESPPEFLQKFLKQSRNTLTFDVNNWPHDAPLSYKTETGETRQCGYFTYAPIEEVTPQLERWLTYINSNTAAWNQRAPQEDPIFVAARAERWLVSIHPYEHGNGRMSRFVMDWLLESLGLPAPILKDQNDDLYLSEAQWARQVGAGVMRAINAAEHCMLQPAGIGCDVIPLPQAGAVK